MDDQIKNIVFQESYVLGWKHEINVFRLFTELLLSENHPRWEKFPKKFYGCYKLAVFTFHQTAAVAGIDVPVYLPVWNSELDEYTDFSEIDALQIEQRAAVFELEKNTLVVEFSSFDIEFPDSQHFLFI